MKAKDGAGSATLSMAYAGARFANAVLRGLAGEKGIVTPTFVKSPLFAEQGIEYFSSNVELGVRSSLTHFISKTSTNQASNRLTVLRRSTLSALSPLLRRSSWRLACLSSRRTSKRARPSSLNHDRWNLQPPTYYWSFFLEFLTLATLLQCTV